ncbi:MAG: delta-60 repeat domain-containing protein, partial [Cytophagales bacterium]
QTDGKILIGGRFTFYNGIARNGIARINSDGSLDTSFNPGTGIASPANAIETMELQTDGKIFIAGSFALYNGTIVNSVARLNTDGTLDTGYLTNTGSGIAGQVLTSALQPDGKIILAGNFSSFNGFPRNSIVRINTNGTRDTAFLTNLSDGFSGGGALALSVQTDGKIIAAGDFTTFTSAGFQNPRTRIVRLNANGTIDSGTIIGQTSPVIDVLVFATAIQADGQVWVGGLFTTPRRGLYRLTTSGGLDTTVPYTTGVLNNSVTVNNLVQSIIPLPDGKVILTGQFTNGGGRIVRLNTDGTQDFSYNGGANGAIWASARQSDGKIIIAGEFTFVHSVARNRVARLNADGTLDTSFNPGTGLNSTGFSLLLQSDGKILVCGTFSTFNGSAVNRLVRLNSDGSRDATFSAPTFVGTHIRGLQRQTDSKYIIGGFFSNLGGVGRNNIARLNADGTLDATFNPGTGTNNQVYVTRLLSDGKILIGGQFTQFNGVF